MRRSYFIITLTILIGCFMSVTAGAQVKKKDTKKETKKETGKVVTVREGVGFNGLTVGRSTMADVVKKYGKGYNWKAFKKYSFSMAYPKLGLAFYMCQSDKKKQIFDIEIRAPFQAKTSKGIVLSQSTLENVYKIYGKNADGGLQYRGVSFFYAKNKGKNVITVIDIVESSGIRQCSEK
ncbi:MAG: hypothetical protein JSS81_14490 [Acidobacteria bacterium]|nr:hypothetical protein [Acidobacteriota bacterium]